MEMGIKPRDTSTPIGAGLTMVTALIPNEWWAWWEPLRYAGIIIGVLLMAWGLSPGIHDAIQGRKIERKGLWLFAVAICAVIVPPWVLVIQSFRSSGFSPPWPDAVVCDAALPDAPDASDKSTFVFYFNGVRRGRPNVGDVMGYFLAGAETIPDPRKTHNNGSVAYLPHELWFRVSDGILVRPSAFSEPTIDDIERQYRAAFIPDVDCHGDNIKTVKQFNFARSIR